MLLLGSLVVLLGLTLQAHPAKAGTDLSGQPEGVRLYLPLDSDGSRTMGVTWFTNASAEGSVARYGRAEVDEAQAHGYSLAPYSRAWSGRLHYVNLTGLEPGTSYRYQVGDGLDNWSESSSFTTLEAPGDPPGNNSAPLSLGLVGNLGTSEAARYVTRDLANGSYEALLTPGGTALAAGDDWAAWAAWARLVSNASRERVLLPGWGGTDTLGNASAQRLARFWLPPLAASTYYQTRLGGLQLLVLDSALPLGVGTPQGDWLEAKLAEGWTDPSVSWRLLSLYEPLYTNGLTGGNTSLRALLEPLLDDYPGTLVVSAAQGLYSRTFNLSQGQSVDRLHNGSLHLTVGHGGARLATMADPWQESTAFATNDSYGHVALELEPDGELSLRAFRSSYHDPANGSRLTLLEPSLMAAPPHPGSLVARAQNYSVQGEPAYLNGSTDDGGRLLRWSSDLEGVILERGQGWVRLANGTHRLALQARWPNSSWSRPRWAELIVNGRPRARIVSYPPLLHQFQTGTYRGTATDDGPITGYEWRSDRDGLISILPDFSFSGLSNGSHNLSFWALDSYGEWSPPATVQVQVNGLPVVEGPRAEPGSIFRGETANISCGGFDDTDPNDQLIAQLRYQDPRDQYRTELLGNLSYSSSRGSWIAQFSPSLNDLYGQYTFWARLIDSAGGASNWREGDPLTVKNNPPQVMGLGLAGEPPYEVQRGSRLELWARGYDRESTSQTLTPRFEYRAIGGSANWSATGFATAEYHLLSDQWRTELTPPDSLTLELYDLRVAFGDGDGGVSDWLTLAAAFKVTNRRPTILDLAADTRSLRLDESMTLQLDIEDEELPGLDLTVQVRQEGHSTWSEAWPTTASFVGGSWKVELRPPFNAPRANYSVRAMVRDEPGMASEWFQVDQLFELTNGPPTILGYTVSDTKPYRGTNLTLMLKVSDLEFSQWPPILEPGFVAQVELRDPFDHPAWQYDDAPASSWSLLDVGVWELHLPLSLPLTALAGNYSLRAQVMDVEGGVSTPLQPPSPLFELMNNPPELGVINISSPRVYREQSVLVRVPASDRDHPPENLSLNVSYRHASDESWQTAWLGPPLWNATARYFQLRFSPPLEARPGAYAFQFQLEDPEQAPSNITLLENLTQVVNHEPELVEVKLPVSSALRGQTLFFTFLASDLESDPLLMLPRVGYRHNGTVRLLDWPAELVDLESGRAPGQAGLYSLEVEVPLEAPPGDWELYGQVLDHEGRPSEWFGPLNLSVENNLPRITGGGFVGSGLRTTNLSLVLKGEDIEDPDPGLWLGGLWLEGWEAPLEFAPEMTLRREPGRFELTFQVPAEWALGTFNWSLGLYDSDLGQSWWEVGQPLHILNHIPLVERVAGHQEDFQVNLSAFAHDPDGQVRHYRWSLDGQPVNWEGPDLMLKAGKLGGGNHTFGLMVEDNDGALSEGYNLTLTLIAPPRSSDSALPWVTARLVGVFMFLGLLTMGLGGSLARSYHATQNELFQLPPYLVEEVFLVSWEGKPVAHVRVKPGGAEAGDNTLVDPQLAREVLDGARLLSGREEPDPNGQTPLEVVPRPGCLGYLSSLELTRGGRMLVIAGRYHFLTIVCRGRPQQHLIEAGELVLKQFETNLPLMDGKPMALLREARNRVAGRLEQLLALSPGMDPAQLQGRLAVRKVQAEARIVARGGRYLWQVLVLNPLRTQILEGELLLDWPSELAHGPQGNKVSLPALAAGSQETYIIPMEPQREGEGLCQGTLDFKVHGSWDRVALDTRPLVIASPQLTVVAETHRAGQLLELEGLADRRRLDYPLPELIKGELVARRARLALKELGLNQLMDLEPDEQEREARDRRGSTWGGQDASGELIVARLELTGPALQIQLVAERPATLAAMVGAFRAQFKVELGEIYDLLQQK